MTTENVSALQKVVGTREQGVNYNVIVNGHGTGLAPPTLEEWKDMVGKIKCTDSATITGLALPDNFDLSTSNYFPTVGDQGQQGSCAAWASTYYAYGFLEAKDQGWSRASLGYSYELMSPAWTYNKINGGQDGGSWMDSNMMVIETWGAATMSTMPYIEADYLSWGTQDAFREAPLHRAAQVYMIPYAGSSTVDTVKSLVYSGTPITFAIDANQFSSGLSDHDYIISASEYNSGTTNHAQTIVGFDNSVSENGDVGAFKIVNSWGTHDGYTNHGYYWLTYNAFMKIGSLLALTYLTDKVSYEPSLLAVWHFNSSPGRDANLTLSAINAGTGFHLQDLYPYYYCSPSNRFPSFLCCDISDLSGNLSSANTAVELAVSNSLTHGTVSSFRIEKYGGSYWPGETSEISIQSQDVPRTTPCSVNNSAPTYSSVSSRTALDIPTNYFGSHGNAFWVSENSQYDFGGYAMQSGDVGDSGFSALSVMVIGPGSVTFDWEVSSESGHDFLGFYLDGSRQAQINGSVGWTTLSYQFADGRHNLQWNYSKDSSTSVGSDCGWIDHVVLVQTDDSFGSNVGPSSAGVVSSQNYSNLICIHNDWYKIWLKPGDDLSVSISFPTRLGDLDLYLYATDGTTVLASSTTSSNTEQASTHDVALWGFYFIEVRGVLGMVNIYNMSVMPTYYPDLGDSSYVRLTSGNGSFASVNSSNKVVGVQPGSTIDGWLNVLVYNAWPSSKTVPFVFTTSWGDHASSYQVINASLPSGSDEYRLHCRSTLPTTDGTYSLLFAFRNENDGSFIASMTASQLGAPIWNDGNDIADLSQSQIQYAQQNGRASVSWNVTQDNASQLSLPMDAITIYVPDSIPPVTNASLSGFAGSNGWYKGTVQVTLVYTDVGTGVNATYYRIDGGSWQSYMRAFSVTGDGNHTVDFYSVDNRSNVESVRSIEIKIDSVPPSTTASVTGTMGPNGWFTSQVTISMVGSDGTSGLDYTRFRLDRDSWQTYHGTFEVAIDGSHTLDYYSVDGAGNVEGSKTISLKTDTGPPTNPTVNTSAPLTSLWSSENTIAVTWSGAVDAGSGVQGYSFVWSQDPTTIPDTSIVTIGTSTTSSALADGIWYLHVRAVDNVGHWANGAYHIGPFKIDTTPPSIVSIQGPPLWSNDSKPQFSWRAPSDSSGILGYSYSVDNLPDNVVGTTSLSIVLPALADGTHEFYIKACDLANNWGNTSSYTFELDAVSPVLQLTSPTNGAIQNSSTIFVSWNGSDSLSGIDHYEIAMDGGLFVDLGGGLSHQLIGVQDGIHVIRIKAIDIAGNQKTDSVVVTVDTVAPSTEMSVNGTLGSNGWYRSEARITLNSSDWTSGVKSTRYALGTSPWQNYTARIVISESGVYALSFYAEDMAGNCHEMIRQEVMVDIQPPSVNIDIGNGTLYNSRSATIAWSSSDPTSGIDHFEYSLDSSAFKSLGNTSSVGLADLKDGSHELVIRAFDKAGNYVDNSVSFRVDTNAVSPTGPFGPWLDVGLILGAAAVVLIFLFALRGRRKTVLAEPPTTGKETPPQS